MTDVMKLDPTIEYNDWDEIYESSEGYWIEDDIGTKSVLSITVFIKEIDNEDFDNCNW